MRSEVDFKLMLRDASRNSLFLPFKLNELFRKVHVINTNVFFQNRAREYEMRTKVFEKSETGMKVGGMPKNLVERVIEFI